MFAGKFPLKNIFFKIKTYENEFGLRILFNVLTCLDHELILLFIEINKIADNWVLSQIVEFVDSETSQMPERCKEQKIISQIYPSDLTKL